MSEKNGHAGSEGPTKPTTMADKVSALIEALHHGKGGKDPTVVTPLSGEGSRPSYGSGWVKTAFGEYPEADQ